MSDPLETDDRKENESLLTGEVLKDLYSRRFAKTRDFRVQMWKVLCHDFFERYIPRNSRILELGAGHCEFINAVTGSSKTAVDINPETAACAHEDVRVIRSSTSDIRVIPQGSVDVVFASNLLEHLSHADIVATLRETYRILAPGGRLLLLQPSIRFCRRDYWMFFDHITPIDDRGLVEVLEISGFRILKWIPRFLPYTTRGRLPQETWLVRAYLHLPVLWRILGKQTFIATVRQ